jgi:TP901 family phage tail tape measure protein
MSTVGEILVKIGVNSTALKTGLAAARGDLTAFGGSMGVAGAAAKDAEGKVGGLGGALGKIAPAAQIAGGVVAGAVVGIGIEAVRSAETFQTSMTGIQNNLNLTGSQAQAMGQAIEQASLGTDSSANTMAAALVPVVGELNRVNRGGLDAVHATQQLTAAQNLHEASNTDLATSLKAITDLELVYHQGTSQAANDATLLFAAQSQLGIGTDTLAGMMQRLQPKLAGSGMGLKEVLATVRELEPVVGTGTRAITTVGTVLTGLTSPSTTAQKALATLGVSLTDAHGKFVGMPTAIDVLQGALAKLPDTTAKGSKEISKATLLYDLFGKQAQVGAALIKGGAAGIAANADALLRNGTAAQAAERNSKTLADQEETLKATMSTMATTLGSAIIPALSQLASAVLPIVQGIATWMAQNPQLSATILGVVGVLGGLLAATAVLAPIIGAIGTAFGVVAAILGAPFLLPIIAIIAAVVLLVTHFKQVSAIVSAVVNAAIGFLRNLVSAVVTTAQNVIATILAIPGKVLSWGSQIVTQAVTAGAKFLASIVTMAGQVAQTILGLPAKIGGALVTGFTNLAQQAVKAFIGELASLPSQAAGIVSHIPGVGLVGNLLGAIPHLQTGADNIPQDMLALIHQGEMILPPDQAQILRGAQTASAGTNTMASALKIGTAKAGVQAASLHVSEADSAVHAAQVRLAETLARRNVKEAAILSAQDTLQKARDRLTEAHTKLGLAEEKLAAAESPTATRTATRATRAATAGSVSYGATTATDPVVALLQQILAALRATRPLVENMTINNPAPEPAGVSIANELRGVGQLGLGSQAMPVPAGTLG